MKRAVDIVFKIIVVGLLVYMTYQLTHKEEYQGRGTGADFYRDDSGLKL